MTRIFEALKKSHVARPAAPVPAPPIQAVRTHAAGVTGHPGRPMADPARLGLDPRPFTGVLDLTEEVLREMTTLRMTLETALQARAPRTVMLMSAQRGEGTSTIAAEFAAVLAREARQRVLLMDVNARRPSPFVEAAFGPAEVQLQPAHVSHGSSFDVQAVPAAAREAGVIAAPLVREWLEAIADRYDWIVIDGPAVLDAPDAPPLAAIADGVVIVVEAGRTKRPVLHRATDLIRSARANLIGSVLNRRRLEIPEFLYRRI